MFENENNEELLQMFVTWIDQNNIEHTGTNIWRISGEWITDKQLIERFLSETQ